MALAGLWENWRSPAGERIRSFAIVTTEPNELCAELHNRMPAIIAPEAWPAWLGEEWTDERHLKALLAPYPSDDMTCWPVSARVGNVKTTIRVWSSRLIDVSKRRCGLRRRVIRCVRCQDRERANQCRKPKSHKRCSCST
jgi:hypothetical protein